MLLKGKSDAKSWVYPLSLFFREYGPLVSTALLPLLVLFSVYFLQILKLSLADEFKEFTDALFSFFFQLSEVRT